MRACACACVHVCVCLLRLGFIFTKVEEQMHVYLLCIYVCVMAFGHKRMMQKFVRELILCGKLCEPELCLV